jgi:hypothetical protein
MNYLFVPQVSNGQKFGFEKNVTESVTGCGGDVLFANPSEKDLIKKILTKTPVDIVVAFGCSQLQTIELRDSIQQDHAAKNITMYAISDQSVKGVVSIPTLKAFFEKQVMMA